MTIDQEQKAIDQYTGTGPIQQDDPGFQPPRDPLAVTGAQVTSKLIYRDLPLVTIQNAWTVQGARSAMYSHNIGIFENSAQLWDSILGDDRVMATLSSRAVGLFGRDVRFESADDSDAAKECRLAWEAW